MAVSPRELGLEEPTVKALEDFIDAALLAGNYEKDDFHMLAIPIDATIDGRTLMSLRARYLSIGWRAIDVYSDSSHTWIRLFF